MACRNTPGCNGEGSGGGQIGLRHCDWQGKCRSLELQELCLRTSSALYVATGFFRLESGSLSCAWSLFCVGCSSFGTPRVRGRLPWLLTFGLGVFVVNITSYLCGFRRVLASNASGVLDDALSDSEGTLRAVVS